MMKLTQLISYIISIIIFTSCSFNTGTNESDSINTNSDLAIVDKNAPVIELTLIAKGNTMEDIEFEQKALSVKAGSTVKLKFINRSTDGSMQHNFVLIEDGNADKVGVFSVQAGAENDFVADMPEVLIHTKMLAPGETTELVFSAPLPGKYQYICTYPGHYAKMQGVFTVVE